LRHLRRRPRAGRWLDILKRVSLIIMETVSRFSITVFRTRDMRTILILLIVLSSFTVATAQRRQRRPKPIPNSEFITLDKTWEEAKERNGISALKRAILPDLIPEDFAGRLHSVKDFNSNGLGLFERSHDLFRDGILRLFVLDGHAAGQMGVLVRREGGRRTFLVADAYWTSKEIEDDLKPTLAFRAVAEDYRSALETRQKLQQLRKQHPDIELVCTHCPDIAARENFDLHLGQAIDDTK